MEALRKAGITENVSSSDIVTSSKAGSGFKEEMNYPFLNDTIDRWVKPNVGIHFPINKLMGDPSAKQVGYSLSSDAAREHNYLIFVFTKENVPFQGNLNYKSVLNWIYRIAPDKRKVQFFDFVIVNKKI